MTMELTLSDINGRFQLLQRPAALPGNCAICGAVDKPVVDFGLTVEFFGAVYICVEDMKAAARILNLIPKELLDQAELVRSPDQSKIEEATDEFIGRVSSSIHEYTDRLLSVCSVPAAVQPEVPNGKSEAVFGSFEVDTTANNSTPRDERPASVSSDNGDGNSSIFSV